MTVSSKDEEARPTTNRNSRICRATETTDAARTTEITTRTTEITTVTAERTKGAIICKGIAMTAITKTITTRRGQTITIPTTTTGATAAIDKTYNNTKQHTNL